MSQGLDKMTANIARTKRDSEQYYRTLIDSLLLPSQLAEYQALPLEASEDMLAISPKKVPRRAVKNRKYNRRSSDDTE